MAKTRTKHKYTNHESARRRNASGAGEFDNIENSSSRKRRAKSYKRKKPARRLTWKNALACAVILMAVIAVIVGGTSLSAYMGSSTDIKLTDEGFTHNERFANSAVINGIDVSVHQGDRIEWPKVKSSGSDFVFIRGGYRSADDGTLHTDTNFELNMKCATKAGIMKGVYFYSQALTPDEAVEEADYLLNLVNDYDVELPLVIDFEIYHGGRLEQKIQAGELFASSLYHNIVLAFCRQVEAAGYESMVYANTDMLTHYMDYRLLQEDADIWLAEYGSSTDSGANYNFWQCGDNGKVGGIEGYVDHNFWYIEPGKVYETRAAGRGKNRVSIGDARLRITSTNYNVVTHRAEPRVEVTLDGKRIREDVDYTYSLIQNSQPGMGYVIIRGIGKYKDWMAVPFEIQ